MRQTAAPVHAENECMEFHRTFITAFADQGGAGDAPGPISFNFIFGKQVSIPVECILPTWNRMCFSFSYHHQMLLEEIGVGVGPEMNKFEQVSSDHNQMSLAGGRSSGLMSMEGKGYLACHLSHDKFDVTYYPHVDRMSGGQTPVKTLPSHNSVGGNNRSLPQTQGFVPPSPRLGNPGSATAM